MAGTLQFVPQILPPSKSNTSAVRREIQRQLSDVKMNLQIQGGSQANKALSDITSQTKKATKETQSFADAIGLSGRRFLAYTSAVAIVGRLTSAISRATRDAVKFEREFVKLAQVFNTNVSSIKGLERQISSLSQEFGISANVIAKTSVVLAQSGLTARQTAEAMRAIAKADVSPTFGSMAATAEGAVAIMAQFKQGAEKLEIQLGAVNAVAKKFAVESQDIIEAIRRAGGAFKAAGGNFEEFIALFTAVRSTTRESAETIATGFRTIFARVQRPKTIEYFKELGIQLKDAKGYFVGPYEAVKRLGEGLDRLGIKAGQIKFAEVVEQLGGIRQVSRVIPLLGEWKKAELALQVAKAGGKSLDEDYAKVQETVAFRIDQVKQQFSALIREFTDTGTFKGVVKIMLGMATALMQVVKSIKPLLPMIAVLGAMKLGSIFGGALKKGINPGTALQINKGGKVPGFARGGPVPGAGNRDTVSAMLEPGEFVIRKSAVQAFGADRLASINKYNGGTGKKGVPEPEKQSYKPNTEEGQRGVLPNESFVNLSEEKQLGLSDTSVTYGELKANKLKLDPQVVGGLKGGLFEKFIHDKPKVKVRGDGGFPDLTKTSAMSLVGGSNLDGGELKYGLTPKTVARYRERLKNSPWSQEFRSPSDIKNKDYKYFEYGKGREPNVPMIYAEKFANGGMAGFKPSLTGRGIAPGNVGHDKQYKTQQLAYLEQQLNEGTLSKEDEDLIKSLAARLSTMQASRNRRFANRLGFASGGSVGTDTVPALLTPGEFVINRKSAEAFGYGALGKINKYARGGVVQRFADGGKTVEQGGVDWAVSDNPMLEELMETLAELESTSEQAASAVNDSSKALEGVTSAGANNSLESRKREKEQTEELLERNRVKKRAHDSAKELEAPVPSGPQIEQPPKRVIAKFDKFGMSSANKDEIKRQRQAEKEAADSSTYALQKPGPRVRPPSGPIPPGYDPKTPKGVGFDPKYLDMIHQEMEEMNKGSKDRDKEKDEEYSYVPNKELEDSRQGLYNLTTSAENVKDGLFGMSIGLSATIFALSDAENELAQGLATFAGGLKTVGAARDAAIQRLTQKGAVKISQSRSEATASVKARAGYGPKDTKFNKKTSKSLTKVNAAYDKKLSILNRVMKVYTVLTTAFDIVGSAALAYSSVLQTAAEKEKEKAIDSGDTSGAAASAGEEFDRAADAQAMQMGQNVGGAVGAILGSIFGPLGTIIGGLIGSFAGLVAGFMMGGDLLQIFWDTVRAMVPVVVGVINAIIGGFNFLLKGVNAVASWFGADIKLEIPKIGPEFTNAIIAMIPDPKTAREVEVANAHHAAAVVKATKQIAKSAMEFDSDMGSVDLAQTVEGTQAAFDNMAKNIQKRSDNSGLAFQRASPKGNEVEESLSASDIKKQIEKLEGADGKGGEIARQKKIQKTGSGADSLSAQQNIARKTTNLKNLKELQKKANEAGDSRRSQASQFFAKARGVGGLEQGVSALNKGQGIRVDKDSGLVDNKSLAAGGALKQMFDDLTASGKSEKEAQVALTKTIFGSKGAMEHFNKNLKNSAAAFGPILRKLAFGTEKEKRTADKTVRGAAAVASGQLNINDLNEETRAGSTDFLAGMLNKGVKSFNGGDIRESLRDNAALEIPGFEEMGKEQQDALVDAMFGIDETPQKQLKAAEDTNKILTGIAKKEGIDVGSLGLQGTSSSNHLEQLLSKGDNVEVLDDNSRGEGVPLPPGPMLNGGGSGPIIGDPTDLDTETQAQKEEALANYGVPQKPKERKKNYAMGAMKMGAIFGAAFGGDTGEGSQYEDLQQEHQAKNTEQQEYERRLAMTGAERYEEDRNKGTIITSGPGSVSGGSSSTPATTTPKPMDGAAARGGPETHLADLSTPGTEENAAAGNAPADLMLTASNNMLQAATVMPKEIELRLNDMSVNLNVNGAEILNALMPEVRKVIVASSIQGLIEFESIKDQNNTPGSYKNNKASQSAQPA